MRNIYLLAIACIFTGALKAQDWSGNTFKYYDIYPGYIISPSGDTTHGYVEHGNRSSMQKQVVFYSDASKKDRKKYKPTELKGYGVADKHYRFVEFGGGTFSKPASFALVTTPGRVTGYTYYTQKDGIAMQGKNETAAQFDERTHTDEILWQRLDEKVLQHQSLILGFAKKFSALMDDYPELSSKIAGKEKGYGLMNIFSIVDEYNKYWAKK